jgi:peroxiredoxin
VQLPTLLFGDLDKRRSLDLATLAGPGMVLYLYPGGGFSPSSLRADVRQHEAYRALREQFAALMPGGSIVALSALPRHEQATRELQLAFEQSETLPIAHHMISDDGLYLAKALGVPTFEHEQRHYYERLTLIARGGRVEKVLYPAAAGADAGQALAWLRLRGAGRA